MDRSMIARVLSGVSRCPRVARSVSEEEVSLLVGDGWRVVRVDVSSVATEEDVLLAIGKALGFPSYFGANWDAFGDCMNEVADGPLVVLIAGWRGLLDRDPALVLRVAHMLASVTEEFAQAEEAAEYVWVDDLRA